MSTAFKSSISCVKHTFQTGDSLSAIAQKSYGDASKLFWHKIYEANKAVIGPDPTQIAIGTILIIPSIDLRAKNLHVAAPDVVSRMLDLVNQRRSENGQAPLTLNSELMDSAQGHSDDMADHNFFSHTGSDGSTPWDRMQRAGYQFSTAGENIAARYATPESVMDAFMNETPPDDGHRRNILNPSFRDIGIGYAFNDTSDYKHYWSQDFGSQS
jgi:uncharacterized protein YkwD